MSETHITEIAFDMNHVTYSNNQTNNQTMLL